MVNISMKTKSLMFKEKNVSHSNSSKTDIFSHHESVCCYLFSFKGILLILCDTSKIQITVGTKLGQPCTLLSLNSLLRHSKTNFTSALSLVLFVPSLSQSVTGVVEGFVSLWKTGDNGVG